LNDGAVTGTICSIWFSVNDSVQYSVVYWTNGERHQDWVKEHELTAF
jgi:hypothetical protein